MFQHIILFCIVLLVLFFGFTYSKKVKEGFFDIPDLSNHNTYVQQSQDKYNTLTNMVNLITPALPVNSSSQQQIDAALTIAQASPSAGTLNITAKNDFNIPDSSPSTFQTAASCESKPLDCSAFDDPTFAANCGMSFDQKGTSVTGKPHIGGKFISPSDRQKQLDKMQEVSSAGNDPMTVGQPTLGTSKRGTFALNKDHCTIIKEQIECNKKQSFNSPNCTQCYTSQNFHRVGPETARLPSTLNLFGNGNATIIVQNNNSCHNWTADEQSQVNAGKDPKELCNSVAGQVYQGSAGLIPGCNSCWCCNSAFFLSATALNPTTPIQVTIPANAEGTSFSLIVQNGANSNGKPPYVAGFIQGETPRGTFKLDIMSLIETDQVSKAKPKIGGANVFGGFRCFILMPGTGQSYMNFASMIPFSFLSLYDGDARTCDNGPVVTQAASATFLESDPCYGKKNKPGNYTLGCLQERWIELGGTQQGSGYPSNQSKADALQKDANGNPLDIDTIVNNLYPKMTQANTGQNPDGSYMPITQWNTVSLWGTGIPINTPCDGVENQTGTPSKECLSYLYNNQGVNSHIGTTYTLAASSMASMKGASAQTVYCQPGAPLDPNTPTGLAYAQTITGGVAAVKQAYDSINRLANDNTQTNTARSDAVNKCYGVSMDAIQKPKGTGPTQVFAVGPGYNYTKDQAQQICAKYGAQVATQEQLQNAQTYGADWCFTGWVSDSSTSIYPVTTSTEAGCGNGTTGIIQYNTGNGMAGVNCYGPKPTIDSYPMNTILPFSQSQWDQPNTKLSVSQTTSQSSNSTPQGVYVVLAGTVTDGYNIWYTDSNLNQSNMSWNQIPGALTNMSLAPSGTIFGVNNANSVFYLPKYNSYTNGWNVIPNSQLRQIYTDGTIVCGTNTNNNAFAATVSAAITGQWVMLPSVMWKIVTYDNKYYCLGLDQHIWYLTTPNGSWVQTMSSGLFRDMTIDENGVLLMLGMDNYLYYSDNGQFTTTQQYTKVKTEPNNFQWKSMSISKGSIYAIDSTGQPWYNSTYKSGNWVKVPGGNEFFPSHRMTSV